MGKRSVDGRLVKIFRDNERVIERLGWKNYDSEEFAEGLFKMVKSLAEIDDKYNKKDLRVAMDATKLSITSSEADLFCRKINDTISYIKRKLRDSGSGARLPMPCKKIGKMWGLQKKEAKAKAKAKAQADKDDGKADANPINIRETLGLPPKRPPLCVEVSDSEEEEEEGEEEGEDHEKVLFRSSAPSSSSALPSALPSSGSIGCPKKKPQTMQEMVKVVIISHCFPMMMRMINLIQDELNKTYVECL